MKLVFRNLKSFCNNYLQSLIVVYRPYLVTVQNLLFADAACICEITVLNKCIQILLKIKIRYSLFYSKRFFSNVLISTIRD